MLEANFGGGAVSAENEAFSQSRRVEEILGDVKNAMQAAEEMGAPTDIWYQLLMHKIASEALRRAAVHQHLNAEALGDMTSPDPAHVQQIKACQPVQEMAYDCVSAGRYDEALLHLGMLGVYLGRLAALPVMQMSQADMERIEHAVDYQFDLTENTAEDDQNKALLKRLRGN